MSLELLVLIVVSTVFLLIVFTIFIVKKPKKLKPSTYQPKWNEIQQRCKQKTEWATLLVDADKLLDSALKKRKFKGGSMGERMVSAQRIFTDNDGLWFAHNLCKKIQADSEMKLRESDVKDALLGFRQALRDVKALEGSTQKKEETA